MIRNADYKNLSPGRLHLLYVSRLMFNKKIDIDFGVGNVRYKNEWSNNETNVYSYLELYSLKGLIYYSYVKSLVWIKKSNLIKKIINLKKIKY